MTLHDIFKKEILVFIPLIFVYISCTPNIKIIDKSDHINIIDFGAIPNDGKDDYISIQNAINYTLKNGNSKIFVPYGIYDLSKGLVFSNKNESGEYDFISFTLTGNISAFSSNQNIGKTSVFRIKDATFILAVQNVRNALIENIVFEGIGDFPNSLDESINYNLMKSFEKSKINPNRYSPSGAIVIDPFHCNVPSKDRYSGYETYYSNCSNSGSSMLTISGCSFSNHYIAIANNPSNGCQNGDNIRIENSYVENCYTFWSCGQTQSRTNSIENVYALFLNTFISNKQIGMQIGTPPTISNVNIAGFCKQLVDIETGFSGVNFYRSYFESIWSLGNSKGLSTSFDQCDISFLNPSNLYFMSPYLIYSNRTVSFRDCNLKFFDNCKSKMPFVFRSSGIIISGGSLEGGVIVADGITNEGGDDLHKVTYQQVFNKCLNKVIGPKSSEKPQNNINNDILLGGETLISSDNSIYINSSTTYQVDYVGRFKIKIDKFNKTIEFLNINSRVLLEIGNNVFCDFNNKYTTSDYGETNVIRSHLGFISSIRDNKIVLSGIPIGVEESEMNLYIVKYPIFSNLNKNQNLQKFKRELK